MEFAEVEYGKAGRTRNGQTWSLCQSQCEILFENNPIPMWVFDRRTLRFLAVNHAAVLQYGFSREEFLTMTIADIRPQDTVPALLQHLAPHPKGLQNPEPWQHLRKDGSVVDVEIVSHDLDFNGADAMLIAAYDVTNRNRAHQAARVAEDKYRSIFENAVVGIFRTAIDGRPISVNPALALMQGYDSAEDMLASILDVRRQIAVNRDRMEELRHKASIEGFVRGAEVEIYRKDRRRMWVRVNLLAVRDPDGTLLHFEGTVEDITEQKAAQAQIHYLAYYDALTALPNRTLLKDRLETALAGARRRDEQLAVLFLNFDHFKIINESLGRPAGDHLLKQAALRLKENVREQDTVARTGSDEFVVLLTGVNSPDEVAAGTVRIMNALRRPFPIEGVVVSTSCTIGISMYPRHGADTDSLLESAERAMHDAKETGRDTFRFYSEDAHREATEQFGIENGLRTALERRELFLVYQPQVEAASGRLSGMEALLRWQHPEMGLIPPDRFIPIAEDSGAIVSIGEWVLRTACEQAARWQAEGLAIVPISVNVSAVQFRQEGFCGLVRKILQETGLPPTYLELEVTESVLLSSADVVDAVMRELKEMGVKVALDDFGTGFSSLSYLKQFRVNKLKIDRSFIRDLPDNLDDAAITMAIIGMARTLNLVVVAEGVETEAQLSFLREHWCDVVQGYYLCKPIAAEEVALKLDPIPA